ncbi:hypothetical protein [Streptosporangium sandarakinum]
MLEALGSRARSTRLSDIIEAGKPPNRQALERDVALRTIYQESC